jgi:hypothetical protein
MRVRSRAILTLIGLIGAPLLRSWLATVGFRTRIPAPEVDPADPLHRGRYIYVFWHETILGMLGVRRPTNMTILISQHRDGEYISQIAKRVGLRVVRGSTTRGGYEALMELEQAARTNHILLTPDGPRGPRRQLQRGAVLLASRTGLPIVPVGFGFANAWRTGSWDRFAIPKPWTAVTAVAGYPISVPRTAPGEDFEPWRRLAESALLQCTEEAEHWAAGLTPTGRGGAA